AAHRAGLDAALVMTGDAPGGDLAAAMAALIGYSERATRSAIVDIPDGRYAASDRLDDMLPDGDPVTLRVTVDVRGDELHVDFSGSDAQRPGPLNAVEAVTRSAVYYCVRSLLRDEVPMNHGCHESVHVTAPAGSVVNAQPPAAVSGGNVETSQRIVDVVLRALSAAVPNRIPAAGQGTMNNVTFGGDDPRRDGAYVWYETLGGGMGGGADADGLSAVHVAMSNTRNTPVEAIEYELPVRITRYAIRGETGGTGVHRGGDGIERVYRFLAAGSGTVISERRRFAPWGLAGGRPGVRGRNELRRVDGTVVRLGGKARFDFVAGDELIVRTPGGGGWGGG
ncbi:MAG: hydantoinase B/oxoprolinase family protein, partial [Chloroflexota bacterium]|nr:hydantoinase B/oxoprolinase family protein [Chloroflexota bacterium]